MFSLCFKPPKLLKPVEDLRSADLLNQAQAFASTKWPWVSHERIVIGVFLFSMVIKLEMLESEKTGHAIEHQFFALGRLPFPLWFVC